MSIHDLLSPDAPLAPRELLRHILAQTPVMLWTTDLDGKFTHFAGNSETKESEAGHAWVGKSLPDLFGDAAPSLVRAQRQALAGESLRIRVPWGDKHLDVYCAPLKDPQETICGTYAIATDVSVQVKTLADLEQSQVITKRIFGAVPAGIVLVSAEGAILDANATAQGVLGLGYDELSDKFVVDFETQTIYEDETPCPAEDYPVSRCLMSQEIQAPTTIGVRRPDGETRWAIFTAVPVNHPVSDVFIGVVVTFLDITERKRDEETRRELQQQLAETQKLEAISQLAGGMAHDLNNVLSTILGQATLLKSRFLPGSPEHFEASTIELAGRRAARVTQQLLGFARRGKHQNIPIHLDDLITEVGRFLQSTLNKNISIKHNTAEEDPWVDGDPGQLQQVILNLAINARDAMPQGGQLSFSTELISGDAQRWYVVSVSDTGIGIPDDALSNIFDPFYTTKSEQGGTGLGLAMVQGIADNHGGAVQVKTVVGQGTTFSIRLPAGSPPNTRDLETTDAEPSKRPKLRIMVVDDEVMLLTTTAALIERIGHEAVTFSESATALKHFETEHTELDLLVIDLVMPGMGTARLYERIRAIAPETPVILVSGYGQDGEVQRLLDAGIQTFLKKPYGLAELEAAIDGTVGDT